MGGDLGGKGATVPPKFEVRPMNSSLPVFHRNTIYHKKCPHPSQGILVIAFRSRKSAFHRSTTKKMFSECSEISLEKFKNKKLLDAEFFGPPKPRAKSLPMPTCTVP